MRKAVALLFVAACGSSPSSTTDGRAPADARPPDAAPSLLIGAWDQQPIGPDTLPEPAHMTFEAGGVYHESHGAAPTTGTWTEVAPHALRLTVGGVTQVFDIHVTADRLITQALYPQGPVTGVVGTWVAHTTIDQSGFDHTITLAADGAATYTWVRPNGTSTFTGTWALDGASLRLTGTFDGTASELGFYAVPGEVIGSAVALRAP